MSTGRSECNKSKNHPRVAFFSQLALQIFPAEEHQIIILKIPCYGANNNAALKETKANSR
eukprot:scaffold5957_cov235-Skeletonema_marinoi.AAC.1